MKKYLDGKKRRAPPDGGSAVIPSRTGSGARLPKL